MSGIKGMRHREFLAEGSPGYNEAKLLAEWNIVNPTDSAESKLLKLIWNRWSFVHTDVFEIAFLLDPLSNRDHFVCDNLEESIEQTCAFAQKSHFLEQQKLSFRVFKRWLDKFVVDRKTWTQERRDHHQDPSVWWKLYGSQIPFLVEISLTVFAVPPSSASCERVWSVCGLIHTKTRNRLGAKKVEMLAFEYVNDEGATDDDE